MLLVKEGNADELTAALQRFPLGDQSLRGATRQENARAGGSCGDFTSGRYDDSARENSLITDRSG